MNLSSAVRTTKSVITANSPVLLVGTAVAGVVATGVLAAKGGFKARGLIDEAQDKRIANNEEPLTLPEKVQLTWLCYAAPVLTGASTIASVVGVHTIHTKRHAALAGLYAVTTSKLDDYREKAEELLGPKKTQELTNAMGQKSVDEAPFENNEIFLLEDGTELCYDEWSGRWYKGNLNKIEAAVNEINRQLLHEGEATVNDYYDALGLPGVESGMNHGWPGGTKLELRVAPVTAPNGKPAISAWFHQEPKIGLGSY